MKHELLAPAGNLEAGYAALHNGADAVYLGLTKFSARAGAENFTAEELDEFTAYAHHLKRKVFVALNTVLTEAEIEELPDVFAALRKARVDALIIQDLGVFYLAKRLLPEIELHASTQMAVHNLEGAKYLQSLGFKRVVLARELSLKEIETIATALPDLDLEVFVHGALCYSYSGQCLFSALEYGKSANRGRCAYPCRSVFKKEDASGHLFSMKDLALEEKVLRIPALSLKIEGRKKSPLYVAAVTAYYRHILDGKTKDETMAEDIKQIFSRPWCQFHFNGKNKDITDENFVGHRGLLIGTVERVTKNYLSFRTTHALARYDGLQIDVQGIEKPFGFGIKTLKLKNKPVFEAYKGDVVEVELPEEHPHLALGAPIYLASSTAVKGKYDYEKPRPNSFRNQENFTVVVEMTPTEVWAMAESTAVSLKGNFEKANDVQKVTEGIAKAFAKTGGTDFCFDEVSVKNPQGLFLPVSVANELRRQLIEKLSQRPKENPFILPKLSPIKPCLNSKEIKIIDIEADTDTTAFDEKDIADAWFRLPQICRNTAKLRLTVEQLIARGVRQFMAENYYVFEFLKPYKNVEIAAGSFLYVANRYAVAELKEIGVQFATLALENSPDNMEKIVQQSVLPLAEICFDYPALFTSAVCIRPHDCQHCSKMPKQFNLKKDGKDYVAVSKNCQIQLFAKTPYERPLIKGITYVINRKSKPYL